MSKKSIRILTRDSFLALAQTLHVSGIYEKEGHEVNVIAQKTAGDIKLNAPLYEISANAATEKEGKAFFTKELEDGLLAKNGDLAVHSLKDLPTELPPGLVLATPASPETPTDTIVSPHPLPEDFGEQQKVLNACRIGTSSLRRIALVKEYFPESNIVPVRGNLITRMNKLLSGETMDVLVLATAGLQRLFQFYEYWENNRSSWQKKLDEALLQKLDEQYEALALLKQKTLYFYEVAPQSFLPAVCQGILGIESHEESKDFFSNLHKEPEGLLRRVKIERTILSALEAGCHIPFGVFYEETETCISLDVYFAKDFHPDVKTEKEAFRAKRCFSITDLSKINAFVEEVKGEKHPVIYCGKKNTGFEEDLTAQGYRVSHYPLIETKATNEIIPLDESFEYGILVSKTAVDCLGEALPQVKNWICVGDQTAKYFQKKYPGTKVSYPETFNGVEAAKMVNGKTLWIGAKDGNEEGIEFLKKQNTQVRQVQAYETVEVDIRRHLSDPETEDLLKQNAWWVFSSPSSVRSYLNQKLNRPHHLISVIGSTTQQYLEESGLVAYHKASEANMKILAAEIMGKTAKAAWQTKKWSIV